MSFSTETPDATHSRREAERVLRKADEQERQAREQQQAQQRQEQQRQEQQQQEQQRLQEEERLRQQQLQNQQQLVPMTASSSQEESFKKSIGPDAVKNSIKATGASQRARRKEEALKERRKMGPIEQIDDDEL